MSILRPAVPLLALFAAAFVMVQSVSANEEDPLAGYTNDELIAYRMCKPDPNDLVANQDQRGINAYFYTAMPGCPE
ncbi:MAG: hypothetical protein AAGK37_15215 [Pseudomonadota bacterium]